MDAHRRGHHQRPRNRDRQARSHDEDDDSHPTTPIRSDAPNPHEETWQKKKKRRISLTTPPGRASFSSPGPLFHLVLGKPIRTHKEQERREEERKKIPKIPGQFLFVNIWLHPSSSPPPPRGIGRGEELPNLPNFRRGRVGLGFGEVFRPPSRFAGVI
jgi:hypothetical protein